MRHADLIRRIVHLLTAIFPHDRDAAMADPCVPFADGNTDCYSPTRGTQHPFGLLELFCFDSSATLLVGADGLAVDAFLRAFPGAIPMPK